MSHTVLWAVGVGQGGVDLPEFVEVGGDVGQLLVGGRRHERLGGLDHVRRLKPHYKQLQTVTMTTTLQTVT
jgi:hypothetical protein